MTNRWNNCNIRNTSLDLYIWFNELYNLNLKFKDIKEKYEKYEDKPKAYIFNVLLEEYKQVRVPCNVNIVEMKFKDLKK